ncbi:phage tail tape measure protein, partial [Erythrobacter sp. HI0074]|uniref:phage tail tape measure protein n=3 Tax=unclassified Erythrobacter TaxID=2633097 RepID=UPI0007BA39B5
MSKNSLNLLVKFSEKGLSELKGGFKNLVGLGKSGANSFRNLRREADGFKGELEKVRKQIDGASGNITELVNREKQLERSLEGANDELRKQGKLYEASKKAQAIRAKGADFRSRGRANAIGGAALLAPLAVAAKAGADFSSQMVDIQQKANLSDAATAQMRNNIIDASRASAQMPDEIAASVESLAGLGMDPQQAAKLALPMGRFMTAFKAQGADTAASLYAGIETLNIPLSQSQKFLDMMAEGGNQGAFEVKDMAAAMPGLTAQMKKLGQTGQSAGAELVAMLQIVRGSTGTSAEAATASSDLLSKLTAPATMNAFKKAGIDAFGAIEKGLKNNISPLETMIALTNQATGGDDKKLGMFFADKEANRAMTALMQNYDKFGQMKKDIAAADGVTDQAFEQRMANDITKQMDALKSAGAGLFLEVAPVLTPAITALTGAITPLVASLADWARENPGLAKTILMTVAGFGAARVALGGLQFAFGGMLGPLSKGYQLWKKYRTLGSIAETFPKLATGVRLLGVAFRFMLGPVGLFLTVLAVVGVAVYRNWDTIKAAFNTGIAFLGGLRDKFLSIGKGMISGLVNGITSAPGRVWNALKSIVMNGVTNVKKLLGINSPSRLFMGFGGNLSEGMAIGIDRKRSDAFASARRLATGVAGAAALSSPAYAGGAGLGPSTAPVSSGPVTIQIYQQPGEDA